MTNTYIIIWIKDNNSHDDDDFNTTSEDYESYFKSRHKSSIMLQKDFDSESRMYLRPKKNAKPSIFVLRFHLDLNKPFFSAQTDVCFNATRPYISHTKKQYSKFFKMLLI